MLTGQRKHTGPTGCSTVTARRQGPTVQLVATRQLVEAYVLRQPNLTMTAASRQQESSFQPLQDVDWTAQAHGAAAQ
jgi:hypothetical protein